MIPRLFVGNFDFEHGLAKAGFQLSAALARRNAELAVSWLAVAEDGDFIWCPQSIAAEFFDQMLAHGLPRVMPVSDLAKIPAGIELAPWGWTAFWIRQARDRRWKFLAPEPNLVREVNSRAFSFELECEWRIGLPGASAVFEFEQVDQAFAQAQEVSSKVVIKANWGMSGRERLLVDGPLADSQRAWLRKRLLRRQAVFVEPWMQRVEEAGIQIEVPQEGPPILAGVAALICDSAGQYRGSWCTEPRDAGVDFHERWRPAVEVALAVGRRLQRRDYFGPVGIDALRYRLPDGSVRIRLLQDINARWTMGRLSLGWQRFLRPGERAFWQHGGRRDDHSSTPGHSRPVRIIETSPDLLNGRPVCHRSQLWVYRD